MALQYWTCTWNNPKPDPATLVQFLNERDWKWVFQEEKGEKEGRDHFQMRINLLKANRMVKHTLLDVFRAGGFSDEQIQQLTPSPESNNGIKTDGATFYCTKVETRVAGPWYDASFTAPKKKRKYEGQDLQMMENPYGWQKDIMERINLPTDDRKINWVYNESGNCGKTKLQKYLCWKGRAKRIAMGLAHQIKNALATTQPDVRCFVMNIPRVSGKEESQRELFSAIEEIKDGWVSAVMYGEEKEWFAEPPHIWIFSNEQPDANLASADRWRIWKLDSPTQERLYLAEPPEPELNLEGAAPNPEEIPS